MSEKQSHTPEFIEIKPGIRVAANVKVPEFVQVHQGENLFDQPPFSWLANKPEFVPENFFAFTQDDDVMSDDEKADQALSQVLARVIKTVLHTRKKYVLPEDQNMPLAFNSMYKTARADLKKVFKSYLTPHLRPDIDLDSKDDFIEILDYLRKIDQFLSQFPDLFKYLEEYWWNANSSTFDDYGNPKPERIKGTRLPRTYAGFVGDQQRRNPTWGKWVGLEKELPADWAEMWYRGEKTDTSEAWFPIYAIALFSSGE